MKASRSPAGMEKSAVNISMGRALERERRRWMKPEEIRPQVGKRVTLTLAAGALGGPTVTGRLVGTTEAADGLVIHVEPDGSEPGTRLTIHYQHVVTLIPAP